MTFRIQKIDELTLKDHCHLKNDDECWYFGEYTAYKDWSFSETNKLIKNFKKEMSLQGTLQWPYKLRAIKTVGKLIASILKPESLKGFVFVPVPPSKMVGDKDYDPRVIQALEVSNDLLNGALSICDCVEQVVNAEADHITAAKRLLPLERANTYKLVPEKIPLNTKVVFIVDDVLTTGSHFKGVEILVRSKLPDAKYYGLFVARRVHAPGEI